jgi:hypothetical protein
MASNPVLESEFAIIERWRNLGMVFAIANASPLHSKGPLDILLNISDFKTGQLRPMISREYIYMLLNEMSNSSKMGNLSPTRLNCVQKISPHIISRMRRRLLPLKDLNEKIMKGKMIGK